MNVELQKSILHTTELYNLESERERLKVALQTSLGPPLARVVHSAQMGGVSENVMRTQQEVERDAQRKAVEERLAKMTSRVAELEAASAMGGGNATTTGRRRLRGKAGGVPGVTLDQYAR
jgi:hypothetical protein